MKLLGIGDSKAYQILRTLHKELIAEGRLTDEFPSEKIPKRYFNKRCRLD